MTSLKGKDYIETQDLSDDEIGLLLEHAGCHGCSPPCANIGRERRPG